MDVRGDIAIAAFQDLISKTKLIDASFPGPKFTWCNSWEDGMVVKERLDNALISESWMLTWMLTLQHTQILLKPRIALIIAR